MNLMAPIGKPLGYLVDGSGATIPTVAVDH
jgi:hypothetical protein